MMEFEEYQNSLFYLKRGYHTYIGTSKKRTFILIYLFFIKNCRNAERGTNWN